MRQKLRRLLSLVLVFSMTMSLLSLNVWAANGAEKEYDYVVTLDNAQEETPVEGLAAELLAQKGIADETGTWSSDNGEVLAIDEAWNAVAYRAGEVTVSYTYMASAEPEEETPGEDLGVIPPEVPGEDEDEGKDDTIPGVNEGEDGTTPGENEGEDGTTPGENEGGEDDTTPGVNEGEDGTTPGENEGGEDDTTPSENEGSENETTPDEIVDDGTNVTEASRIYYTGPEGGEVETITETWTVLVQDCDAIREIRALMQAFLDDYTEYANAIRAYVLGEELDTDLDFDEFDNRYGEMQDLQYTLRDMGIDWPAVPGTQEDYDLYDDVMKLVTGEAADLAAAGNGTIQQSNKLHSWGRNPFNTGIYSSSGQSGFFLHYRKSDNRIAYCVEPGAGGVADGSMTPGEWNPPASDSGYTHPLTKQQIRTLVSRVIACGFHGNYNSVWFDDKYAGNATDGNLRAYAIATQLLVWEVVAGDRDANFNLITHVKDADGTIINNGYIKYAYSKAEGYGGGNMFTAVCGNEYNKIEGLVKEACSIANNLPTFESVYELDYVRENNYSKTVCSGIDFTKYDVSTPSNNVSVQKTTSGLVISATAPFQDVVNITVKTPTIGSDDGIIVWSDGLGSKQDVVMYSSTPTADVRECTFGVKIGTTSLTVKKDVTGEAGNTDTSFHFTVNLTYPDGKKDSKDGTASENAPWTITGLPIGTTYTVTETSVPDGYVTTIPDTSKNALNANPSHKNNTVTVINNRGVGSLSLTKALDGEAADTDTDKVFNFTVTFTVPSDVTDAIMGNVTANANGQGTATAPKKSGSIWVATADLHGGETATFKNLPAGTTYTVTEPGATQVGYDTKFEYSDTNKKIAAGDNDRVTVTNTRYNGNLAIKKVVEGQGDTTYPFHFEITLKDGGGNDLTGISYIKYNAQGTKDSEGTTNAGTTEFTLKHNEMIAFQDVPNTTTFTVTEKDGNGNGYVTTSKVDTNQDKPMMMAAAFDDFTEGNYDSQVSDETTVTEQVLRDDDWYIVTFTNSRKTGSLTLTKDIDGNTESGDKGREWEFVVTLKDVEGRELTNSLWRTYTVGGSEKVLGSDGKLTLTHGQEAKFANLPYGTTYTIQESGQAATSGYKTLVSQNGSTDTAVEGNTVVTGMIGKTNSDKVDANNTEIKDHTVKYTNAWTKGNLIVTKTMGGDAAADEKVTFEIALDLGAADILKDTDNKVNVKDLANWISGDDQTEDGTVTAAFADDGKTWVVTITKDVKTDGKTIIAELGNIPTGVTYTVTETTERLTEEGYEVVYTTTPDDNTTSDKTTSGTITNDGETDNIEVQDYRAAGSLEISKKVVSDVIIENAGEQFTFKIDLTNVPTTANNEEFLKSHIKAEITNEGEAKGFSKADVNDLTKNDDGTWTWEIKLVDGATATISGLPASTKYTVRELEANLNGYITSVQFNGELMDVATEPVEGTISNKIPTDDPQIDKFLCTNTRFDGNLAVMKVLTGDGAYDTDEFAFTMELTSPYGLPTMSSFGDGNADSDELDASFGVGVGETPGDPGEWWDYGVLGEAEYKIYENVEANGMDNVKASGELYELLGSTESVGTGDNKFHFTLRGGDMIVFDKLPDQAKYTVTEDTNNWNGYSTDIRAYGIMMFDDEDAAGEPEEETYEQQSSVSGMIDKNADQLLLTCVNHRGVGELAVSKLLVGTGADASRSWTFRVRLTDANGDPLTVNAWTANGEEKQLTVKETGALVTLDASGMTTLTMRGGETRTITNLPNGTRYSVEEVSANTDGYYTSSSNTTGTIYEKTEEYDGVSRVTFTNRREPGTLTVSKTVGGNAGDVYRPFEFVVTLTAPEGRPGDSLPNPVKARLEDYREGTETELTLPLSEENTVTFELTHDQAMVLLDLDEGTGYSVAETPAAGYVTRVAGDIEGVLSANGTAVAAFTNTANVYREGDDDDDDDDTTRTEERGPGEEPELPVELPNPNEPDSPDTVTILEDDVPTTYVKVPDPENEEEFIYIPEDEIPLQGFEIPETGDNGQTILWAVLSAASLTGIVALGIPSRKKEEEEQ